MVNLHIEYWVKLFYSYGQHTMVEVEQIFDQYECKFQQFKTDKVA